MASLEPTNRLRADFGALRHAFRHILQTKSHEYSIELGIDDLTDSKDAEQRILADTLVESLGKHPYNLNSPPFKSRQEMNSILQTLAAANESQGLPGLCNSSLAVQLFQETSKPWGVVAEHHVNHAVSIAKNLVCNLLRYLIGSESASPELNEFVTRKEDDFLSRQEEIPKGKVSELLEPYVDGYTIPLNTSFRRTLLRDGRGGTGH